PIRPRLRELTEFQKDPEFASLPEELRDYVEERIREMKQYRDYKYQLQLRPPSAAQSERDVKEIETGLKTSLALPHAEWAETEAGRLHADELQDVQILRASVAEEVRRFEQFKERGRKLWEALNAPSSENPGGHWSKWYQQTGELIDE